MKFATLHFPLFGIVFLAATMASCLAVIVFTASDVTAQQPGTSIQLSNEKHTGVAQDTAITLELSPDESTLLVGSHKSFHLMRTADLTQMIGHRAIGGSIADAAFSPDSKLVATVGSAKVLQFWNAKTGSAIADASVKLWYLAVEAHSMRNECVAGGASRSLYRWDMSTGKKLAELETPYALIQKICLHPDGRHIITSSHPPGGVRAHVIELRDFDTLQVRKNLAEGERYVTALVTSPDKKRIAWSTGAGTVQLWDAQRMQKVREFQLDQENVRDIRFLPDSRHLLVGGWSRKLTALDTATGSVQAFDNAPPNGGLASLAILSKPTRVAMGRGRVQQNQRLSIFEVSINGAISPLAPKVKMTQQPTTPFFPVQAMPAPTAPLATSPLATAPQRPAKPPRLAVPPAQELVAMKARVRELLEIDVNGKIDKSKAKEFANKLAGIATEEDDPATKYAAMEEAARLAAIAGEQTAAQNAIDLLDLNFDVDRMKLAGSLIRTVSASGLTKQQRSEWGQWADRLAGESAAAERPSFAFAFYDLAFGLIAGTQDKDALNSIKKKRDTVRSYLPEFIAAKPFRMKLIEQPDDPQASLGWGRYLCFVRGHWGEGLPLIVKGSDEELRTLATEDLATPDDAAAAQAIAAKWIAFAERSKDKNTQRGAIESARFWLTRATGKLAGLSLLSVEKQLKELPPKSEISRTR